MANFTFLTSRPEYALFAEACLEAERVYATSPAMCAIGCRKALELAIKWVYAADSTLSLPYRDNLQSLLHEESFMDAVDVQIWRSLQYIVRLGNLAVHSETRVKDTDAVASLTILFNFIDWIDYCYGSNYESRTFSKAAIPTIPVIVDTKKVKEQQSLIELKDEEIKKLQEQIASLSAQFTAEKAAPHTERGFNPTEAITRKDLIDIDLRELGWIMDGPDANVRTEVPVADFQGVPGKTGYVDYVLYGRDNLPLAIIEAKRTSRDEREGRNQARDYADCLERACGRRPMIFLTNGYETRFAEQDLIGEHPVSGIFTQDSLQRLMNRRRDRKELSTIPIDQWITNRPYQMDAVRSLCEEIEKGRSRHLFVMATGAGKTRTAASVVDVLSKGNYVTNVLFLADRRALVRQARDGFKKYLPRMSLCNLLENRNDISARIVFSTYPTILNAIDMLQNSQGQRAFSPAHFDLIIVDECHRSIFKKYGAIFKYFDAQLLGLTATPKEDIDHDTYAFFEMESRVPTKAYTYDEAKAEGHLVPYYSILVKRLFEDEGITYDKLSDEDKARYESDFSEDDETVPSFVPSSEINRAIFNDETIDEVLQEVMTRGMKVGSGDRIAKTIIFAQNKNHAEVILKRFRKLYPELGDDFIARVICDDSGSDKIIADFKQPESDVPYDLSLEKRPHIVISVDMMDTGIDVPHVGNLVFFKVVRSKTKFWQMVGRGTRKCPGMECVDFIDGSYTDKKRFFIFDYCGNFDFFRANKNGIEAGNVETSSEMVFKKRVRIAKALQDGAYAEPRYQAWRNTLVDAVLSDISGIQKQIDTRIEAKLQRRYIDSYSNPEQFTILDDAKVRDLCEHIAPITPALDDDDEAKRFDNFMYGLILMAMEAGKVSKGYKKGLRKYGQGLQSIGAVPVVTPHLPLIQAMQEEGFADSLDILKFEETRENLRGLIRLIPKTERRVIETSLTNPVLRREEGAELDDAYDFEDYRLKVNRYVNENKDNIVIHKLTHNQPLTVQDYHELERILTVELGNKEEYINTFGETPFGLLVRQIAKMDHEAATAAFADFINQESLTAPQINFVRLVIAHIEQNGYMEDPAVLLKPPFDRPVSFVKLFGAEQRQKLLGIVKKVRENAEVVA